MAKNPHDGHRDRFREKFREKGITKATPPHEILELLLYYCVPRSNTNVLAHELYDHYGTIAAILDAPEEELVKFKGLTERGVFLLKMILPVTAYCAAERMGNKFEFSDSDRVGRFLLSQFYGLEKEKLALLFLDGFGRKMKFEFVAEGDAWEVNVPIRQILKSAVNSRSRTAVMAHNHPFSSALPSSADMAATEQVREILAGIGIELLDHIIISENDYVSLRQSKEYAYVFKEKEKYLP